MTLTNRISSLVLGLVVVTAAGIPLAMANDASDGGAQPGTQKEHKHDGKGHRGKHKGCGAMKALDLNEAQKAKLKESHQAFREQNKAAMDSLKAKYQQLKQLGKDEANAEQRKQLLAAIKQERSALNEKRKASMQGILTTEQQSKWESLKQQCKAKHHQKSEDKSKTPTG